MDWKQKPKKQEKTRKVVCCGCAEVLKEDHIGIVCMQNCAICPKCAINFVNVVMEHPDQHLNGSLKCMTCKSDIIIETFERQLDSKQAQLFVLYNLQFNQSASLAADEEIVACPFCDYWEINSIGCGRMYFVCKHSNCNVVSCFWCKKLIRSRQKSTHRNNNAGGDDQKDYEINARSLKEHYVCAALENSKKIWDAALEEGAKIPCPECGISGMKNNACTHMTCTVCQTQWCYVCGLAVKDLDTEYLMEHQIGWRINKNRCPMWLSVISKIDKRWPEEPNACVTFLHQLRGKQALKKAIVAIKDRGDYEQMCKIYNIENSCGFDIRDIMEGNHTLIQRKNVSNANRNINSIQTAWY